jgi:hypothetical protein
MGSENLEVEKVQVNFLFWMLVWGKGTYLMQVEVELIFPVPLLLFWS